MTYMNKFNISIPDNSIPYLDSDFKSSRIFFKLTDDTEKVKFNFSTGLGFIKFK